MTTETLFDLPPANAKPCQPRGPRSQRERCRRCKHGASDADGCYCRLHDLCISFDGGQATTDKDDQPLECVNCKIVED
jgi:hypothetical protein